MPRPQPSRRHPDLFASRVSISASERTKLLALMSSLLVETLSSPAAVIADHRPAAGANGAPKNGSALLSGLLGMLSLLSEAHV